MLETVEENGAPSKRGFGGGDLMDQSIDESVVSDLQVKSVVFGLQSHCGVVGLSLGIGKSGCEE